MAGIEKPLKGGASTPRAKRDGIEVGVPLCALSKYTVESRVFHPNKNFEPLGFRFHGDNRGFSHADSWFGKRTGDGPTSRIWQRYVLDTGLFPNITSAVPIKARTESNFSDAGPSELSTSNPRAWGILSWDGEEYDKVDNKPRGKVQLVESATPHGAQKVMRIVGHQAGENHAFLTSTTQQYVLGTTAVPTLDAFHDLFVRIERLQGYMDIVSICYGDGFPNCESFMMDASGKRLFLGTHVRIGYPATHLWAEQNRLIYATSLRIEIDKLGNFGSRVWIFANVLGGPPNLRDDYPILSAGEVCRVGVKEPRTVSSFNVLSQDTGKFVWDCGRADDILRTEMDGKLPIYLSATKSSIAQVRQLVHERWRIGPSSKTTLDAWNHYHRYRDPNKGRAPDSPEYQIADDKWMEKRPL